MYAKYFPRRMKLKFNLKSSSLKVLNYVKHHSGQIALVVAFAALGVSLFNGSQVKNNGGNAATTFEKPEKIYKELPKDAPFLGNPDAKMTIVEFGDFQCPYCGRFFNQFLPILKKDYIDTGKIKFVYMDYAFLGQESKDAAEAAKCAAEQGKFWEYHDQLYKNQKGENIGAFNPTKLKQFASNINLDANSFDICIAAEKYEKAIEDELNLGKKYGVRGTPNFIIGKQLKTGTGTTESFKQIIDAELKNYE
jgi:protein-disulfide isomerase